MVKLRIMLILYLVTICIGSFNFGFLMGMFNHPNFNLFSLKDTSCYQLNSKYYQKCLSHSNVILALSLILGAFLGNLLLIPISYITGRKKAIFICDFIGLLATSISFIESFPIYFISRFVQGITCGFNAILIPIIIKEMTDQTNFSIYINFHQILITLGIFVSFLNDNFFTDTLILLFTFFIRSLILILFFSEVDTPLCLIHKEPNDKIKLKKSMKLIYPNEDEYFIDKAIIDIFKTKTYFLKDFHISDLFSKKFRTQFIISLLFNVLNQFSCVSLFIFSSSALNEFNNCTFTIGIVYFVSTIFGSFIIYKIKRKNQFVYLTPFMIISLLFHFILHILEKSLFIINIIFFIAFPISIGSLHFIYPNETLPDIGVIISYLFNWTSGLFVGISVNLLIYDDENISTLFLSFFIACVIIYFILFKILKESKFKSVEQNSEIYEYKNENNQTILTHNKEDNEEVKSIIE